MRPEAVALALVGACFASRAAVAGDVDRDAPPAAMLLELDVLRDEAFAAPPPDRGEEDAARDAELLESLDRLGAGDDPDDGSTPDRRTR